MYRKNKSVRFYPLGITGFQIYSTTRFWQHEIFNYCQNYRQFSKFSNCSLLGFDQQFKRKMKSASLFYRAELYINQAEPTF